jgi:hypothetical protein
MRSIGVLIFDGEPEVYQHYLKTAVLFMIDHHVLGFKVVIGSTGVMNYFKGLYQLKDDFKNLSLVD